MAIHRLLRPLALAGAVVLALGGCGGDDDDVSSGAAGGDASAAPSGDEHGGGHGGDAKQAAGAGSAASATDVEPRTVEVEMKDELVYNPSSLTVKGGEKIRFVFKNTGLLAHDALIGDAHAQDEHAAAAPGKGHDNHHRGEPPPFVTVPAGGTEEVVYSFNTPGEIIIGCHQAGHFAAGMKLPVTVS